MAMIDRTDPRRADSSDSQYSIMEFMREFPDDAACLEWLWRTRYSEDGIYANCARCETRRVFRRYETKQRRHSWTCTGCGLHIHPTADTIFHKSSTSLQLWFYAMYLMTSTRCGISAKQIERELGVNYKTAWRMCKLIRHELMVQDTTRLNGQVEADETFYGGKPRVGNKMTMTQHLERRVPIAGAVERGGRVIASVTQFRTDAGRHVVEHVLPSAVLFTDEYAVYQRAGERFQRHHRINHSRKIYVSGEIHTQTIEGFWSLVKNGIRGVYHNVSHKHLQDYLNEYAWRYNHRHDGQAMFRTIIGASARESQSRPVSPVPDRPRGLSYRPA